MQASQPVTSRRKELEALFKRYPDVPREVIVKEDILNNGNAFTEAALKAGQGYRTKMYGGWLFTFDWTTPKQMKQQEAFRVPDFIELKGGIYGLRGRVRVRCRINPDSPYIVDVIDGKLMLCDREGDRNPPICELHEYRPIPNYWSKQFADGTPYREVCRADGFVTVFTMCQHWGPKEECKFCDINENHRMSRQRGVLTMPRPFQKVDQVADVMEEIFFKEKRLPHDRPTYVLINGGSITKKLDGLDETDFYLGYVEAIRDRIGNRWLTILATAPKPKDEAKRLYAAGVNVRQTNIEVWDRDLFNVICPGKARVVGWDEWVRRMLDEVDVFGEGNITPALVCGVEMAQPWGFKDVASAVKSTTEGIEFLMSHGVVPRPLHWCVEPLAALRGQKAPPIDYFIQIDRFWFETLVKYRLPRQVFGLGPGRNEHPIDAAADMGWA